MERPAAFGISCWNVERVVRLRAHTHEIREELLGPSSSVSRIHRILGLRLLGTDRATLSISSEGWAASIRSTWSTSPRVIFSEPHLASKTDLGVCSNMLESKLKTSGE